MQLEHEGSPFVHGFLWGLGFAIAGAIVSSLTALLWMAYINHQVTIALDELTTSEPAARNAHGHWVDQIVGPQSREACLTYTHGVANEQYQKCRTGFRERKWVSDSDK